MSYVVVWRYVRIGEKKRTNLLRDSEREFGVTSWRVSPANGRRVGLRLDEPSFCVFSSLTNWRTRLRSHASLRLSFCFFFFLLFLFQCLQWYSSLAEPSARIRNVVHLLSYDGYRGPCLGWMFQNSFRQDVSSNVTALNKLASNKISPR